MTAERTYTVADRNYIRGLLVERGYYVTNGDRERIAAVDVELGHHGVSVAADGTITPPAPPSRAERPGGNVAAASPTVETAARGRSSR